MAYGLSIQTGLLLLLLVLCPSCIRRPEPMLAVGSGEIELSLLGFRNSNGQALVSLFRDPEGFPDRIEQSVVTLKVNIDGERALVRLGPFPWGRYAISLLHDENGDGQMNSSWLGTPLEGFGFSGYPEYRFGQPDYEDVAFLLATEQLDMTIKIRYTTGKQQRRQHNQDVNLNRQQN